MFKILKCNTFQTTALTLVSHCILPKKAFSSGRTNLAAFLYAPRELKLEECPIPKIKSNEVLAQVEVCGICGSDMHLYSQGKLGNFLVTDPIIIGHEASGTILECGDDVQELKVGDKIAIEPQHGCRTCEYCKVGKYNICPNQWHAGIPPDNGTLTRYIALPFDVCYKLPDNVDYTSGALIQPLTVAVRACRRAEIKGGDVVLIMGAGTIGLMTLLSAKYFGASKILIVDIDESKLCKAKSLGASKTLNSSSMSEQDIVNKVKNLLGAPPNKSFDCVGVEKSFRPCVLATKPGGKVIIVGLAEQVVSLPSINLITRELEILGSWKIVSEYPLAIDMVASGKVDLKPLITHNFKFKQIQEALELLANKNEPSIKVLIHLNPNSSAECST